MSTALVQKSKARQVAEALANTSDEKSFLQNLLADALEWPIPDDAESVEAITYSWSKEELRAEGLDEHLFQGQVRQIQPLRSNAVWGIFLVEFKKPDVFTKGRGMTGPLRKVLRGLVPSKRRESTLQAWKRKHLLFLCTHNYRHFRFAYFKAPPEDTETAPLASFGWGPDIPARTVSEFNLPALVWPEPQASDDDWVRQWAGAFDIEKVTRRFYLDYADVFDHMMPLCGLADPQQAKLFTQTLLNRLLFIRFLERKGWLRFKSETAFLKAFFADHVTAGSFYKERLLPLFFQALAKEHAAQKNGELSNVPFLNGGLFEETELDRKVKDLPDEAWPQLLGKDGLLYRYNFTVEESTPLDIDVAVDPEMLGKVFEELVTGRHETGSYYTPRSVVSFMCREALKGYLESQTEAPASGLASLIDKGEVQGLNETHGKEIMEALDRLKAVDPACGSGAYLLGLLQEMVVLYRRLINKELVRDSRSLYDLKLRIISHNLYGTDSDQFACNIAMLRLWLSLSVEAAVPEPLPNLDFKIERGDSLTGPCKIQLESFDFDKLAMRADILVDFKEQYLKEHGKKKDILRRHILDEERAIADLLHKQNGKEAIDWRVQFAEVMGRNRGFDIVLANPPYVRQELITDLKPALEKQFDYIYQGTADLYVYFYVRGLELLRDGGVLAFIAPNKFFRAGYGKKLRSYLVRYTRLQTIIDFADYPIFQAITYPAIIVTRKGIPAAKDKNATVLTYNWRSDDNLNDIVGTLQARGANVPQAQLTAEGWNVHDDRTRKTMDKLRSAGMPLRDTLKGRLYYGIKTGCNEAFEIDETTRNDLVEKDPKSNEVIKPWLRGRNINRWSVDWSERYLLFTRRGIDINRYPAVKAYLQSFREQLEPRPLTAPAKGWKGRKPGSYKWYEVQDAIDYWKEFDKPKIVYQVIATYQQFAFTEEKYVTNDKTWIIPEPPPGLLAILNSKLTWFFLDQVAAKLQGGAFELRSPFMVQVPIVTPSKDLIVKEKAIWKLAQAGEAKSGRAKALEKDVDEIVVRLYGLDRADVQVIDEALAACGNRFPFKETEEFKEYRRTMFGEE